MSQTKVIVSFNLGRKLVKWQLPVVGLLFGFLTLIAFLIAPWWLSPYLVKPVQFKHQIQHAISQTQLESERIEALRNNIHAQVAIVASRIGTLQAKSSQLDLLSEQLAQVANVDQQEFIVATVSDAQELPLDSAGGPLTEDSTLSTEELVELLVKLDHVVANYDDKQRQLELLSVLIQQSDVADASWLSGRPVRSGALSSGFGVRKDPITGRRASHWGVDFAGRTGDDVLVTAAGVVTWAGYHSGYGNMVEVSHGGGYTTRYGHNDKLSVSVGNVVTKGDVIASMGSTGRSTGPHVHYEVLKNGRQVNPSPFIFRK
ncbi:M23 family metallopeptidase [Echinimonas agarilytica]|uniref:M23 family metallopeptidase n=1 Tax=Echinimonas agarilytica TaxID=1215918 RepID=A0AA42B6I0_9GAMM|nr:M23 family metallopeptidase [Echinimonas agarilytica]MCM2678787.1 M23 family metallopeptidase [Echinimonas agarilytica]